MGVYKLTEIKHKEEITRLVAHCQHLQDVAFDLDLNQEAERIEIIDEMISTLKLRIDRLRSGFAN